MIKDDAGKVVLEDVGVSKIKESHTLIDLHETVACVEQVEKTIAGLQKYLVQYVDNKEIVNEINTTIQAVKHENRVRSKIERDNKVLYIDRSKNICGLFGHNSKEEKDVFIKNILEDKDLPQEDRALLEKQNSSGLIKDIFQKAYEIVKTEAAVFLKEFDKKISSILRHQESEKEKDKIIQEVARYMVETLHSNLTPENARTLALLDPLSAIFPEEQVENHKKMLEVEALERIQERKQWFTELVKTLDKESHNENVRTYIEKLKKEELKRLTSIQKEQLANKRQREKLKQNAEFFNEKLEIILADFSTRNLAREFTVNFEREFLKLKYQFQAMLDSQDVYYYSLKKVRVDFRRGLCEGSGFETREELISFIQGCLASELLPKKMRFFFKQKLSNEDFQILSEEEVWKSKELARQEAYKYLKALYVDMPVNVAIPQKLEKKDLKKREAQYLSFRKTMAWLTEKSTTGPTQSLLTKIEQFKNFNQRPQTQQPEKTIEFSSEYLKIILNDLSEKKSLYINDPAQEIFEYIERKKNQLNEKLRHQKICQYDLKKLSYNCKENLCEGSGFETENEFISFVQGYSTVEDPPEEIQFFLDQKLSECKFQMLQKEEVKAIKQLAKQAAQSYLKTLYDSLPIMTQKKEKIISTTDYGNIKNILFQQPDIEHTRLLSKALRAFFIFAEYIPYHLSRKLKQSSSKEQKEKRGKFESFMSWLEKSDSTNTN